MRTRNLITATMLGVLVFLIKGPLLAPYADFLIIFEAILISIGYALLGRGGATYVELVNGILLTVYLGVTTPQLAPFVLPLALLYGALTDVIASLMKAKVGADVKTKRLAIAVTISSAITGLVAYIVTVPALISLNYIPNNASMDLIFGIVIIVVGVVEGAAGGFLAARIWERNLKARFGTLPPAPSQS